MENRRDENYRESWYVKNLTKKNITIGDLPSVPAIKPGKKVDILKFYSKEKVGHSKILVKLVKARIVSLNKQKIFSDNLPGPVPISSIDKAITSAEENEIDDTILSELGDFIGKSVVTEIGDPGSDDNIPTEQAVREALIDEVISGDEITDDTGGILLHGKDPDGTAQPVGIQGVENDEVKISDIELEDLLDEIIKEMKIMNLHMAIITDIYIRDEDII